MKNKIKDIRKIKESEEKTSELSFEKFKEMVEGFTDEELNLVSDWLLVRQHKL